MISEGHPFGVAQGRLSGSRQMGVALLRILCFDGLLAVVRESHGVIGPCKPLNEGWWLRSRGLSRLVRALNRVDVSRLYLRVVAAANVGA